MSDHVHGENEILLSGGLALEKLDLLQVLNVAVGLVLLLDAEGKIIHLNDSGHALLGYAPGQLIGEDWFESCLPSIERERARAYFQSLSQQKAVNRAAHTYHAVTVMEAGTLFENTVMDRWEQDRIFLWRNSLLYSQEAEFLGILSTGEDITAYRTEERIQKETVSRYRALIECFPLGITVSDAEGHVLETNRIAEALLGVPRSEHETRQIASPDWNIIHVDGTPMSADEYASVRALREKRAIHNVEMGIVRPDKDVTWLSVNAAPVETERGGVVIAYEDVTERKRERDILKAKVELSDFAEAHSLDALLQRMLDKAEQLTGSAIGFFHILESDEKTIVLQAWSTNTLSSACRDEKNTGHADVGVAGIWADCVQDRVPVIHNDCDRLSHRIHLPEGHTTVVREMFVPVFEAERIVAILGMGNKQLPYVQSDVDTLTQLAHSVWDIVQRKHAEMALAEVNAELALAVHREQQLSRTDELTGVYSRRSILEEASRESAMAKRYRQPYSVMLFDIDHFKSVNDRYGHAIGDEILIRVANTVQKELRAVDVLGRIGGEEFLVLMPMTRVEQAMILAERIRKRVQEICLETPEGDVRITISVGVVEQSLDGDASETHEILVQRSDSAMYAAKAAGRNQVRAWGQEP